MATSQAIRREHGWEHELGSPHATREALADAVMADIARHGADGVVALAVSHADCEDLADRIRHDWGPGHFHGPELARPAWGNGERRYATGDQILVHGTSPQQRAAPPQRQRRPRHGSRRRRPPGH